MATPQEVIKKFMSTLDNTSYTGVAALNGAVYAASNGKFTTMSALINSFISDATRYGGSVSAKDFLLEYCGIDLDNDDTGSIIGADAGSGIIYTKDSIVEDRGSLLDIASTRNSYTVGGVTLTWDRTKLDSITKGIINRICSWWAPGAFKLIEQAYGLTWNEPDVTSKKMTINFYTESSSTLANANHTVLNINLYHFNDINLNDPNGSLFSNKNNYMDRALAHEFTHSLMFANITDMNCYYIYGNNKYYPNPIPQFVVEGLADLVHGIDDWRRQDILSLISNPYMIRQYLDMSDINTGTNYCYSAGYMLFRYLAKQAATTMFNQKIGETTILPTYADSIYDASQLTKVTDIDATQSKLNLTIKGNSLANTIKASAGGSTIIGGKGNDKIYAGAGADTIQYAKGDGTDTIYNLSASDKIKFTSDSVKSVTAGSTGTDVVITTTGGGKMTLKATTGKTVNVVNSSGTTTKYIVGRNDANNTFTWNSSVNYIGGAKSDTLNVNSAGGTVDLTNATKFKSIDVVNASKATKAVTIKGGAQSVNITGSNYNDTIKAGSAGGTITGGKGNDTITAGAGVDTIVITDGMGTDTITGFSTSDKIKVTSANYSLAASGSDVVVTAGTGKAVIKSGIGKNIQVVDKSNATTKFNVGKKDIANTFTWSSGVNYIGSSKSDTVNVNTGGANADLSKSTSIDNINASKANKAVTIKGGAFASTITGSAYNDKITAGSKGDAIRAGKGNDTIYAGSGADVIQYAKGEGNDIIYNFSGSDKIKFVSDSLKSIAAASTGTDVIITTANNGKITLKAATGKILNIVDSADKTTKYMVGRADANNSFTWAKDVRFVGSAKTDTLTFNAAGGTIDLTNTTLYKSIDAVNASKATKAVTLKGGTQAVTLTGSAYNDTIKAGSKGGTITGGKGNDTITAGAGTDTIVIADGMGTDTITGFSTSDKIKVTSGSYNLSASGSDVVVTAGTGKAVIKAGIGKNIQVVDKNNAITKFNVGKKDTTNTFTWAAGVNYIGSSKTDTLNVNTGGANVDASKFTSIDVINASKADKAVTIKGGATKATITGSAYNDTLTGDNAGGTVNGGAGNDTITAGSKGNTINGGAGNDTIKAGAGTDTILIAAGMGTDTVAGFSTSDRVKVSSGTMTSIAAGATGTDVNVTAGTGKVVLKSMTGKTVQVMDSAGIITKYVVGRNDVDNSFAWANGVRYVGTGKKDTLNISSAGGTIELTNTTLYKSIDVVNAASATNAVTIKGGATKATITGSAYNDTLTGDNAGGTVNGGAGNDKITAGGKGNTINGGKGDDNIYLGAGTDSIMFASGDGNDVVYNYSSQDNIYVTSGNIISYTVTDGNGIIKTDNGTITLKGYNATSVYITGSDNVKREYSSYINGLLWNKDKNKVKFISNYSSSYGMSFPGYSYTSVKEIDASDVTGTINISGNSKDNIIYAGKAGGTIDGYGGNDTIYLGAGNDKVSWYVGEGNDTVYNFNPLYDTLYISGEASALKYSKSSNDIIIKNSTYNSTLTLKNGNTSSVEKYLSSLKINEDGKLWNEDKTKVELVSNYSSLYGTSFSAYSISSIKEIDASNVTGTISISGNSKDNIIYAGKAGGTINGYGGNDTIYLGDGADKVNWYIHEGNDTIYNFNPVNDKLKINDMSSATKYSRSGDDIIITNSVYNATLTLKNSNTSSVEKYLSSLRINEDGKFWNEDKTKVELVSDYSSLYRTYFFATSIYSIKEIDASNVASTISISGNSKDNIIYAGKAGGSIDGYGGNDTIYLGAGNDKVSWYVGEGNDIIYNFNPLYDTLYISGAASALKYSKSGNDIIIKNSTYNSTLTLKNGNTSSVEKYLSTLKINEDGKLWNEDKTKVELVSNYSSLYGDYFSAGARLSIKEIDASNVTGTITIYGNYNDNIIYAGKAGGTIYGMGGNDTIYLNSGADYIEWATNQGSDTIYGFDQTKDRLYLYKDQGDTEEFVADWSSRNSDEAYIVIYSTKTGNTLTLENLQMGQSMCVWNYLNDYYNIYNGGGHGIIEAKTVRNNDYTWIAIKSNYSDDSYSAYDSSTIQTIDATKAPSNLSIRGNSLDNVIRASINGSTIDGDRGNDTIYLNSGTDTVKWWAYEGNDIVYNFDNDKLVLNSCTYKQYRISGSDIIIDGGQGCTLTLKNANTTATKSYLSSIGVSAVSSSYQSTLGCLASSMDSNTSSASGSLALIGTSQPVSTGSMVTSTISQSELSALKKGYM